VAEMRMLQFSLGLATHSRCHNEVVRKHMDVGSLHVKLRKSLLRWKGYLRSKEESYAGNMVCTTIMCGEKGREEHQEVGRTA